MSRIGRMPVAIPAGVTVAVDGSKVTAKGPKGELTQVMHPDMIVSVEDNMVHVARPSDDKLHRSLHGLTRSLIHNMVIGVSEGYKKRSSKSTASVTVPPRPGNQLQMNLGYSHQVVDEIPGITIEVPAPNKIIIHGIDKQKVGQFAAEVREKRPPEPYKGKGIKYIDEVVRRKEGKAGGKKK